MTSGFCSFLDAFSFFNQLAPVADNRPPPDDPGGIAGDDAMVRDRMRNNPPHYYTDDILDYLESYVPVEDSVLQRATWEAIGWFDMSYRAPDIAEAALKVSQDEKYPVTVRKEALKTYNRTK